MVQVQKKDVVRWLLREGFSAVGRKGGHECYERDGIKVVIVARGHGRKEMSPNVLLGTLRQLELLGYERDAVLSELGVSR